MKIKIAFETTNENELTQALKIIDSSPWLSIPGFTKANVEAKVSYREKKDKVKHTSKDLKLKKEITNLIDICLEKDLRASVLKVFADLGAKTLEDVNPLDYVVLNCRLGDLLDEV